MDINTVDPFECKVSQMYKELPQRGMAAEGETLDEFFDVLETPGKSNAKAEQFFTPFLAPTSTSPIVADDLFPEKNDENITPVAAAEEKKGRIISKARRRSSLPTTSHVRDDPDSLAEKISKTVTLKAVPSPERRPLKTRTDTTSKCRVLKRKSDDGSAPPQKYVCLAEKIHYFFKNTPPRFRRTLNNQVKKGAPKTSTVRKLALTVPGSPRLLTKERARSPSKPVEERCKPKILPFAPVDFNAADSKPILKPTTVVQPFSFKEAPKKEFEPSTEELFVFKARKTSHSCPNLKQSHLPSGSSSTSCVKSNLEDIVTSKGTTDINSIAEEVPSVETHKGVYHIRGNGKFTRRPSVLTMEKRLRCPSGADGTKKPSDNVKFKANPPAVLRKSPFKVRKSVKPVTAVSEFVFSTEKRAKERKELEKGRKNCDK